MPITMKKEKVRSKGPDGKAQVVGLVNTPDFSAPDVTLDQIVSHFSANGADGLLKVKKLVTTQNATNLKNEIRSDFSGGPSTSKLREEALAELGKMDDLNKVREILTDPAKREAYIESQVEQLTKSWKERQAQRVAEVAKQIADSEAAGEQVGEDEGEAAAA